MLRVWVGPRTRRDSLEEVFSPALRGGGIEHRFHRGRTLDDFQFDEIQLDKGDLLLVMGESLVKELQRKSVLPKNLGMGKLRESLHPHQGGHVMVSYSPGIIHVNPRHEPEVKWDARLACRYVRTGRLEPETGAYRWVDNFNVPVTVAKDRSRAEGCPIPAALDLETVGLDPYAENARIVSVAISVDEGESWVVKVPESGVLSRKALKQLKWLCSTKKVKMVGANLKFDAHWLLKEWDIPIDNHKFDTMLVGSLLNENMANSLEIHAKMHTSLGGYDSFFNEKHDKSRMDLVLRDDPEGFLTYAGGDTDACLRVYAKQRSRLMDDERLANFYMKLTQPVSDAFTAIERRGVVVDRDRYLELEKEVSSVHAKLHGELVDMLPRRLKIKYRDDLKITRPVILKDLFFSRKGFGLTPVDFTEKTKAPSTSMNHLKKFLDNDEVKPFVLKLREFNSAQKTLTTYIRGFMSFIRSDGRFHPTYYLGNSDMGGTDTGRSSCKDPGYQTIPRHTIWAKPLRSVYTPPPGHAIVKVDFSQGELRVAACIANELNMINAYRKGIDLHLKTGAGVNDIGLKRALKIINSKNPTKRERMKGIRQSGKIGNFGMLYEISAAGLAAYAYNNFNVVMSLGEAQAFKDKFFKTYPGIPVWHKKYHMLAARDKMVRSPLGRIRHLPLAGSNDPAVRASMNRKSVNSPVQSALSDMCALAIAILYRRWPELWVFGFTHDEIQAYVPLDDVELWGGRIKEVMENLPLEEDFGWRPQLTFPADAEWSPVSLAECGDLVLS